MSVDPIADPAQARVSMAGVSSSADEPVVEEREWHRIAPMITAFVALCYFLFWARTVLIPISLAVCLRYGLMPLVTWMERRIKAPKALSAALVLAMIVAGAGAGISSLNTQVLKIIDKLPQAVSKFEATVRQTSLDKTSAMAKLDRAATKIEAATNAVTAPAKKEKPVTPAPATPSIRSYLWTGSLGLAVGLAQGLSVLALTYFLLIGGDTFKRKLVRLSGDTFGEKKLTVRILADIDQQIQRYFLVQIVTSLLFGVMSWLAFTLIGLEDAAFWGLTAGVLHLIPYVGSLTVVSLTGVVAYLQFPTLGPVLMVIGSIGVSSFIVGLGITPWLTGKLSKLSPVSVFVSLLVWGWLWGVWGLLLGVPIVMAIKVLCEHIQGLEAISELLGSASEPVAPKEADKPAQAAA